MPTLYTPEAKTQGLDWLAGMVQSGQQLWQKERNLQQEAQRLQVAKQQMKMQSDQFWASQARLADQEEFQNRKFMYSVKQDERNFEWGQIKDNRNADLAAQQEARLAAGQTYNQDPNNPQNQYMVANTDAAKARAEQDRAETDRIGADPWAGVPDLPAPAAGSPGTSNAGGQLLPDITKPSGEWGPSTVGDWHAPMANPPAAAPAVAPTSAGARSWKTGDPMTPVAGVDALGNKYNVVVAGTSANGAPFYQRVAEPREKEPAPVTWEVTRDKLRDNVTALQGRFKIPPSYPRAAKDTELSKEQISAYQDQVRAVRESNRLVQQQIDTEQSRIDNGNAREEMKRIPPPALEPTPKFASVAPLWDDAVTRRDPIALENLRLQIKVLADDGDPAAIKALAYVDKIGLTKGPSASVNKDPVTGATYYKGGRVPK